MKSKSSSICLMFICIIIATLNCYNANANPVVKQNSNHYNHQNSNLKTSANEPAAKTTPITTNGNVYGPDNSGAQQQQQQNSNQQNNNNPQSVNRGYNQGYTYNTGIKPYQSGYTYFQPFGDAVNNENNNNNADNNNTNQQLPIQLPNFFGIDPKQMGPVRVVHSKNIPLDENGIPILDAIHIPENNNDQQQNSSPSMPSSPAPPSSPLPSPPPPTTPPVDVPVNANDFTGDFNFNNILSGTDGSTGNNNNMQNNLNNGNNGMFDFTPPSTNNFNIGGGNGGGDQSDYNRLDDFAGNLNNFDTYLGDPSLMLDMGNNANRNNNNPGGLSGFGFDGQQVPSEIVNLNNAFGTGNNQNNNGRQTNLNDILNQFSGGGGNTNANNNDNGGDLGDFGNFGSSSNGNGLFPFF